VWFWTDYQKNKKLELIEIKNGSSKRIGKMQVKIKEKAIQQKN